MEPPARIEKRFLALLLVFILGILMLLNDMPSGGSRRERLHYPKALVWVLLYYLLLFGRPDDHDHLTTFHLRHLLDGTNGLEVCLDSLQLTHAEFLVRHFAAPEAQGHFDLVALFQEARHVPELDLVIVFVGAWAQLDFFYLHLLLLQLGFVSPLLFLILELAVVHDPADWRLSGRRDLNQIDSRFFSQIQSLANADNA